MTQQQKIIAIVVIVLVVGLIWSFVGKRGIAPANGEPIKIGAIIPLSGWGAYWGTGEQKGIELAVKDLQAQGMKVQVVVEDSKTDGKEAATAAQKLINIDKVSGILTDFTGPASAVSPIAAQAKVPFIFDAFVKGLVDTNPYALKTYFDAEQQCYEATRYLGKRGHKVIGSLILQLDFNAECKKGMERAASETGVTVRHYDVPVNTTDFRTIITKMKRDGVQAVVPVVFEDHALIFFKERAEQKFLVPVATGIGKPDAFSEKIQHEAPVASLDGTMTYDQALRDWFIAKAKAEYSGIDEKDLTAAAYGYDMVMYLARGFAHCSTGDAACAVRAISNDRDYQSTLESTGFGGDRVFDITPTYYRYQNGTLTKIQVK